MQIKWPWKKKWKKPAGDYQRQYYDQYMNAPGATFKKRKGRITGRVAVAALLLVILLAAREMQLPLGQQVRDQVRYLLTAEWNFEPLLQGAVRVASQITNWENPMFHSWPSAGPAQPVTGDNVGPEGIWVPVSGKIVREFGFIEDTLDGLERFHPGVDIQAPAGSPVRAVMDGQVSKTGRDDLLGAYILLKHGEENYTMYAGLAAIVLEEGQQVSAGQEIGAVGEKGDVPGGGLHFEMREKGKLIDPLRYLQTGKQRG